MIAPPRVASPGRSRARSRHKEQQQRPRAQTDWMSYGDAIDHARSASPGDREPVPQHFPPPVQQQQPQVEDLLDFMSFSQPASVPNPSTTVAPQNLPFSAPNPAPTMTVPTTSATATTTTIDPFRQASYEWQPPTADQAPPAATQEDDGGMSPRKRKKKKKKKEGRGRSKTVGSKATSPRSPPSRPAPPPPSNDLDEAAASAPAPKRKIKEIDVLPLLHTGVPLVKFKMTGGGRGKSKRFTLSPDNKFLCWEGTKFAKSADDRQVYLGDINEVNRLDVSALSGARLTHPHWAMSIIYTHKGAPKTLNVCAQTAFHFQMIFAALRKLSVDAKPPHISESGERVGGRDLANMFELYLQFAKEDLPEHLRKQKFKWEAVPQAEFAAREEESRQRAMTTPIGVDPVSVEYPGMESVPTANSEQIMQRDRAFSAGLAGGR